MPTKAVKFSIITVTRNNRSGLARTLQSIRGQDFKDFEVIVIDGGSQDGSGDVVRAFDDVVDVFQQDEGRGIYPAMNQGVRLCSGDWVIFMNAGDSFADGGVLASINPSSEAQIVFGDSIGEQGAPHLIFRGWNEFWKKMPFCHQAMFTRRELALERPLDSSLSIVADFDFILWARAGGKTFEQVDTVIAIVEAGGASDVRIWKTVWQSYRATLRYHRGYKVHRFYWNKLRWAYSEQRRQRSK
jgi:glycosyltransferase involved in cell wall biosynthesis